MAWGEIEQLASVSRKQIRNCKLSGVELQVEWRSASISHSKLPVINRLGLETVMNARIISTHHRRVLTPRRLSEVW